MKKYQKEYEEYVKGIVDKFSDMCSVKNDYLDYCNYIQSKGYGVYYNFRQADVRTLVDILTSGDFENKNVHKIIQDRQEKAKKWLSENLLSYDEWFKNFNS